MYNLFQSIDPFLSLQRAQSDVVCSSTGTCSMEVCVLFICAPQLLRGLCTGSGSEDVMVRVLEEVGF